MSRFAVLHPAFLRQSHLESQSDIRFHLVMTWVWLVAMGAVFFIPAFTSSVAALFIIEISLYSNFATEFGALGAIQAANKLERKKKPFHALCLECGAMVTIAR